jgi:hypothetical protein
MLTSHINRRRGQLAEESVLILRFRGDPAVNEELEFVNQEITSFPGSQLNINGSFSANQ